MADKFLSTGGSGSVNISDGSANIFAASLAAANLDPSRPIKTNAVRQLVSTSLDISDTQGLQTELDGKLANPLTADFNFQGFEANGVRDVEFAKLPNLGASTAGTVRLYANNDGKIHQVDESGVDIIIGGNAYDQGLNTTDDVKFNEVECAVLKQTNTTSTFTIQQVAGGTRLDEAGAFGPTNLDLGTGGTNPELRLNNLGCRFFRPLRINQDTDDYELAADRGSANQVLTSDGVGGTSWQPAASGNPFDQTLNTTDSVSFAGVELASGGKLGWTGKPSQQLLDIGTPGSGVLLLNADANLVLQAPQGIQVNATSALTMQGSTASVQANTGDAVLLSVAGDLKLQSPTGQIQLENQTLVGTPAGGYTLPLVRGTVGQYLRQNLAGIVSWTDFPSAAHGIASMVGNSLPTSFAASGVYTQIVGVRTGSQLQNFTFASNALEYTGAEPSQFLVNVSQSWIHALGTPDEFRLAIFVNGVIVPSSEQRCNLDSDSDYPRSSSTNAIISLSNGDQVDVRIANFDDTTTGTVIDHSLTIVKVGLVAGGGGSGGDVIGPGISVDNGLALFDGTSGELIKEAPATLDATGIFNITAAAGPQIELSDTLNDYQLGLFGGSMRLQKGLADKIWDTTGNRFNSFRNMWVQADLEFNAGANSVVLPQTRGLAGQSIVSDGVGGSAWSEVPPKVFKVYSQVAQNFKAATAAQSIYNILGPEGLGTKTVPANSPLGTSIAFKCSGTYTYSGGTTNILLVIGGNTLPFGFAAIGAVLGYQFEIDLTVSLRTLGAGGTAWVEGSLTYVANPASGQVARIPLNGTIPVNTTVDNVMDLQASFTAVGNNLTTESGSIIVSQL